MSHPIDSEDAFAARDAAGDDLAGLTNNNGNGRGPSSVDDLPILPADSHLDDPLILDPADPLPTAKTFIEHYHIINSVRALQHQSGVFFRRVSEGVTGFGILARHVGPRGQYCCERFRRTRRTGWYSDPFVESTRPVRIHGRPQLYLSVIPPSTTSSMPVTYFDSSDARYRQA